MSATTQDHISTFEPHTTRPVGGASHTADPGHGCMCHAATLPHIVSAVPRRSLVICWGIEMELGRSEITFSLRARRIRTHCQAASVLDAEVCTRCPSTSLLVSCVVISCPPLPTILRASRASRRFRFRTGKRRPRPRRRRRRKNKKRKRKQFTVEPGPWPHVHVPTRPAVSQKPQP